MTPVVSRRKISAADEAGPVSNDLPVHRGMAYWHHAADPARCAGAGEADFTRVFNAILGGRRNVCRWRFRRSYAVASISTPLPYEFIFGLVSAV
jgi:hypothetical protein